MGMIKQMLIRVGALQVKPNGTKRLDITKVIQDLELKKILLGRLEKQNDR